MSRKIAILGAGKIGESLISGLLSSNWRTTDEIVATARSDQRVSEIGERYRIEATRDNKAAVSGAGVIVIAVKPQDIEELLADLSGAVVATQTVLSIAAAIPTALIEKGLEGRHPGRPRDAEHAGRRARGHGGISAGSHAEEKHMAEAEEVLSHLGRTVRVAENYMDAVTAVSGSGPAYFALLAESMIEAGILLGLSREISTQLVVQTMLGTATLLRDAGMHPVELREMVTSPGGTTIAAIRELEQAGVRAAFLNAIQAAMTRSKELAAGGD